MVKVLITIVVIVILGVGWMLVRQSKGPSQKTEQTFVSATTAPTNVLENVKEIPLEITYPPDGSVVSSSSLVVRGKTLPNITVFVNELEIKSDKDGNFSQAIEIDEGENDIFILASDEEGNYQEAEITVVYEVKD